MDGGPRLTTARLVLRRWEPDDLEPFAALNADPEVMEHFPAPSTRARSDELARWIERGFEERGFGLWAVEVAGGPRFIGFVGLNVPDFEAHFTPTVEVAWRLARQEWGRGYATEAAAASLAFGFEELGLGEIVAFTVPANVRSRRVMERLNMTHDPADDFEHPRMPAGHRLRAHVLYRASASTWAAPPS